jgi:hypothetical protein
LPPVIRRSAVGEKPTLMTSSMWPRNVAASPHSPTDQSLTV